MALNVMFTGGCIVHVHAGQRADGQETVRQSTSHVDSKSQDKWSHVISLPDSASQDKWSHVKAAPDSASQDKWSHDKALPDRAPSIAPPDKVL